MLVLMLMLKLSANGAIETNVFLSSIDARVNVTLSVNGSLVILKLVFLSEVSHYLV